MPGTNPVFYLAMFNKFYVHLYHLYVFCYNVKFFLYSIYLPI